MSVNLLKNTELTNEEYNLCMDFLYPENEQYDLFVDQKRTHRKKYKSEFQKQYRLSKTLNRVCCQDLFKENRDKDMIWYKNHKEKFSTYQNVWFGGKQNQQAYRIRVYSHTSPKNIKRNNRKKMRKCNFLSGKTNSYRKLYSGWY